MQNKMKDKKTYIKPEAYVIESEYTLLAHSMSTGDTDEGSDADGFMSKGDTGFEDFGEFDSLDTDTYSAANWRKNNLWDTNLWD